MDIWTIVSAVLGLLAIVGGGIFLKVKGKLGEARNLLTEAVEVVTVAVNALDDNKITPDEVARIKKEALEVKTAWKKLLNKP